MQQHTADTVSIAAAMDLINACLSNKLITSHDLKTLNIPSNKLTEPAYRIPETSLIALWKILAKHNNDGIALRIGATINPNAKGLLASWISQTHTLREALNTFIEHISLMNPSESWQLIEDEDVCTLMCCLNMQKGYPQMAIERSMSAMLAWGRILSGHQFCVQKVNFLNSAPNYQDIFSVMFNAPVEFNQNHNSIIFQRGYLELPVVSSNALLKSMLESKAKVALKDITVTATLSEKISKLIRELLEKEQAVSITLISEKLSMSRQTLYRALKKDNTDFQTIFDEVRKAQATQLLTLDYENLESISLKLGYKDSSSFYKAFKRWYGQSPSEYKESRQ